MTDKNSFILLGLKKKNKFWELPSTLRYTLLPNKRSICSYDYICIQNMMYSVRYILYGKILVPLFLNTSVFFTVFFSIFHVGLLFFSAFCL